ncbi:transposase [Telluria mixta]|uniref:Transposase n=1 Tax=Telluria mixta TaxID=34071 RepID=A0ABT2C8B2_9BURK|nr:transposase [Telluria mixta]MCS0632914.1 transposase [Telluria mixta]WEM97985.1 transposase [Telluria mixta]
MARQPRLILPKQPHLIIQRGNDNQVIFRDDEDYRRFLDYLRESAKFYRVAIHAYVLMPNHLHLLATPSDEDGLAAMMQKVGRLYVPWFNNKYGRSGTLFQGRFRTSVIDPDAYFLACIRYIELNPLRSQLAFDLLDYPWSSYAHHAGVRPDPLITDHAKYWELGNTPFQREAAFIELVQQGMSGQELDTINAAVLKGAPLGSHAFKVALEHQTKRQILPAKRGRPFKVKAAE